MTSIGSFNANVAAGDDDDGNSCSVEDYADDQGHDDEVISIASSSGFWPDALPRSAGRSVESLYIFDPPAPD